MVTEAKGEMSSNFTFNFQSDSTVYQQVSTEITGRPGWKKSKAGDVRADVWLCDGRKKNAVPYALLGQDPTKKQLVNYYRGSGCITLKSTMVRTLGSYMRDKGMDPFTVLPVTYILYPLKAPAQLPEGLSAMAVAKEKARRQKLAEDDERDQLLRAHAEAIGRGEEPSWILKSSAGGKGEGITISRSVEELVCAVDSCEKETAWVISRYLERPMLIHGRKFDLRCWVLLDADYGMHFFEEGVLRTSSFAYDAEDLTNHLQHLTNHCVQATAPEFGSHEEGNELSFQQMEDYMRKECGGRRFYRDVLPQMTRMCALSLEAGRGKMQVPEGSLLKSFQLFGFDFMVDSDYKVWLIEINGNPASREALKEDISRGIVDQAILPQFPSSIPIESSLSASSHAKSDGALPTSPKFIPITAG